MERLPVREETEPSPKTRWTIPYAKSKLDFVKQDRSQILILRNCWASAMRLVNFTFASSIEIEIVIAGRPRFIDLHNIYGWQSVTYLPEQRRIRMIWTLPAENQNHPDLPPAVALALKDLPAVVTLEFRGVSRFAASPHDPGMPYHEDTCLEAVTFTPSEPASGFKSEFEVFRNDTEHITFMFRSGFGLKIWAEEAELIF